MIDFAREDLQLAMVTGMGPSGQARLQSIFQSKDEHEIASAQSEGGRH
jgi:hypothetical protein